MDSFPMAAKTLINSLSGGLDFNTSLGSLMSDMALIANPGPKATFFILYAVVVLYTPCD